MADIDDDDDDDDDADDDSADDDSADDDNADDDNADDTAAKGPSSEDRLAKLLRSWGPLVSSVDLKRLAKDALPQVKRWLTEASNDPITVLRLTQFLLADTATPGIHKRSALQFIWRQIDQQGIGFGGEADHVRYAQAVLLAAWPRKGVTNAVLVPAFFEAAWGFQNRSEEEATALAEWRAEINEKVDSQEPHTAELTELLWWGQAQYCHWMKAPYRRVTDPTQKLFLVAFEIAERAFWAGDEKTTKSVLAIAPTAAYAVHVLSDLGLDVKESRPLYDWLGELHQSLKAESNPRLTPDLVRIVGEDCLGLPVSWVRWLANEKRKFPTIQVSEKSLGLSGLSSPIDRGDFAALVLRECLLDFFME